MAMSLKGERDSFRQNLEAIMVMMGPVKARATASAICMCAREAYQRMSPKTENKTRMDSKPGKEVLMEWMPFLITKGSKKRVPKIFWRKTTTYEGS